MSRITENVIETFYGGKTSDGKEEASPCGCHEKTGVVTIETVKKLAAYHQYYAVNRAVESTLLATETILKQAELIAEITVEA